MIIGIDDYEEYENKILKVLEHHTNEKSMAILGFTLSGLLQRYAENERKYIAATFYEALIKTL